MGLFLAIIFTIGGLICHQRPDRSFFVDTHQLPVCARCTGLYLSAAIGLVGWWTLKLARGGPPIAIDPRLALRVVVIAAVPTVISVATGTIGLWDGSNLTRAMLAIPLGLSAGAIMAAVATKDLR